MNSERIRTARDRHPQNSRNYLINKIKILRSDSNGPIRRSVPDRTALPPAQDSVDRSSVRRFDPQLVHLQFEHSTGQAQRVRGARLVPVMTLE